MRKPAFTKGRCRVAAYTDPSLWPVSLTVAEVAILTRQSAQGLYRRASQGTARPMPVLTARGLVAKPIRFYRDTVKAHVMGRSA